MPSPFPGMDPFIEASGYFPEFHGSIIVAMRDELNARLPEGYAASLDLYVWVHEPTARRRQRMEPDVYVSETGSSRMTSGRRKVLEAPRTIILPAVERRRQKFVKIEDLATGRVVTVLELISPANKEPGKDREAFLAKRSECLANGVSLVEIDLLRGGRRLPLGKRTIKHGDFYVMVCRSWEFPRAGIWEFGIHDLLPDVPIPLSPNDPEPILPLRTCMDKAYDGARYAAKLRYGAPLSPRLSASDASWVKGLLSKSGRT